MSVGASAWPVLLAVLACCPATLLSIAECALDVPGTPSKSPSGAVFVEAINLLIVAG